MSENAFTTYPNSKGEKRMSKDDNLKCAKIETRRINADPPLPSSLADDRWNWLGGNSSLHQEKISSRYNFETSHLPSAKKKFRSIKQDNDGPCGRCSHSLTVIDPYTLLLLGGGYSNLKERNGEFEHLDDIWLLNALTAKWNKVEPSVQNFSDRQHFFRREDDESNISHWGMRFGPPRRGHMVAYYASESEAAPMFGGSQSRLNHQKVGNRKGFLIVFGGLTNIPSESHGAVLSSTRYLDDVWLFDFPSLQWRRIQPNTIDCKPPNARRAGISWIDGDYFYILGGDIHGSGHEYEAIHRASTAEGSNSRNQSIYPVYKLGPLSKAVSKWSWSIQKTFNSSLLHKRAPNWPTVTLNPIQFGAIQHASQSIIGRKLWIFGGLVASAVDDSRLANSNLLYRLNLDTFEWVVIHAPKRAPCPRYCHSITSIGRFLVVAGGIGFLEETDVVADVATDDPDSDDEHHQQDQEANGRDRPQQHQEGPPQEQQQVAADQIIIEPKERTIFDLYIFDTEAMKWTQGHPDSISGTWPGARNAFTMAPIGGNKIALFGGGVYPSTYFNDLFALEFDLPKKIPAPSTNSSNDVCNDLGELYKSSLLSDLDLVVGGGEASNATRRFPVHRAILAARCDYFQTMLNGPYAESTSSEIFLPDVDCMEAVDVVLKFLYTGKVDSQSLIKQAEDYECIGDADSSPGIISAVLELSDLWNISKLSEALEDALASSLRHGQMDPIELISFAKAHNCRRLVTVGLEFAKKQWNSLKISPSAQNADEEIIEEIQDFVHSLL